MPSQVWGGKGGNSTSDGGNSGSSLNGAGGVSATVSGTAYTVGGGGAGADAVGAAGVFSGSTGKGGDGGAAKRFDGTTVIPAGKLTSDYGGGGGGGGAAADGGAWGNGAMYAGSGGGWDSSNSSNPKARAARAGSDGNGAGGGGGGTVIGAQDGARGGAGIVLIAFQLPDAPSAPTGLSVTPGDSSAVIAFTAGSDGGSSITNYKYSVDGGAWTLLSPPKATSPVTIPGLTNGATYSIKLLAVNGVGDGAESTAVTVTPAAVPAPPDNGGGSSGGGSSTTPAPSPTPTPTPSATATPALEPTLPGSNPNIPTGGVPLGGSVFLVNGEPVPVTVKPDAPSATDATGLDIQGPGFTMRLVGQTANNRPLGLTPDGALILEQDRTAYTEGTGFKPNSEVQLYVFSQPRFLGTVSTDANGSFRGSVPLPVDIPAGRHTLQSNGFAPDGAVRSLSLGVQVQDLTKPTARPTLRTTRATVYFDAYSAELTPSAKKSLRALAKGRAAYATRTLAVGYVQPSGSTANDITLSTKRAKAVAKYLKSIGVKGVIVARGDGVATQTGAAGRKVIITLSYRK